MKHSIRTRAEIRTHDINTRVIIRWWNVAQLSWEIGPAHHKKYAPRTAHELAHLSSIAQAFKTCADELPPIAQAGENICSSCSSYNSFWAKWASSCSSCSSPWENMGRWGILHSSSLKTCADELSPIAQAEENMRSSCSSYSSSWAKWASSCSSYSPPWANLYMSYPL